MNYIIEDGIDFFAELAKNDVNEDKSDACLLSGEPLVRNHITLPCKHRFNYRSLYHEVIKQKTVYNPNDNVHLRVNEMKCPYCRQITSKILPYIPCIQGVTKVKGVNDPYYLCMNHKKCSWCYKTGKKKGEICSAAGFDTDYGAYCTKHWGKILLNASKHAENVSNNTEWTTEMEEMFRSNTVASLKEMLREKKLKVSGAKKELVMRVFLNK